jgi:hypothetical protein
MSGIVTVVRILRDRGGTLGSGPRFNVNIGGVHPLSRPTGLYFLCVRMRDPRGSREPRYRAGTRDGAAFRLHRQIRHIAVRYALCGRSV